jgi:hypothetical protein
VEDDEKPDSVGLAGTVGGCWQVAVVLSSGPHACLRLHACPKQKATLSMGISKILYASKAASDGALLPPPLRSAELQTMLHSLDAVAIRSLCQ